MTTLATSDKSFDLPNFFEADPPTDEACDRNAEFRIENVLGYASWYPRTDGSRTKCVITQVSPRGCETPSESFEVYLWPPTGDVAFKYHHCSYRDFEVFLHKVKNVIAVTAIEHAKRSRNKETEQEQEREIPDWIKALHR